jgi:hypothetical protein
MVKNVALILTHRVVLRYTTLISLGINVETRLLVEGIPMVVSPYCTSHRGQPTGRPLSGSVSR